MFKSGEFAALFKQASETVDLIFLDGLNWQALLKTISYVKQKYGDEKANVQAIERDSNGCFRVKLDASNIKNKAGLEDLAKRKYLEHVKSLESSYEARLREKDVEIHSYSRENSNMLEILKMLADKPINFKTQVSGGHVNQAGNMCINNVSDS